MKHLKKYSLELEESLVKIALKSTGKGFTETVRQGLKIIAATQAYNDLTEMAGTVDLEIDAKKLRRTKRDNR